MVDLVQIAAEGLAPKSRYNVYLADSNRAPYGNLRALAVLKTNPDGAGIVQAVGPLKTLASNGESASAGSSRRFLIITEMNEPTRLVLQQAPQETSIAGR
jgi:hypothetical protein